MKNLLTFKHYLNEIYLYNNGESIATICDGNISLISSYYFSDNTPFAELNNEISHVVFKNYFGGLWENHHQEIKKSIYDAVSILDKKCITSSLDFLLNREYILK
jgi:hypothetical protein